MANARAAWLNTQHLASWQKSPCCRWRSTLRVVRPTDSPAHCFKVTSAELEDARTLDRARCFISSWCFICVPLCSLRPCFLVLAARREPSPNRRFFSLRLFYKKTCTPLQIGSFFPRAPPLPARPGDYRNKQAVGARHNQLCLEWKWYL